MNKRWGEEEHDTNPYGLAGDRATGRGRKGGNQTEAGRERKGPSDRITPGSDRDLGAGQGWKMGSNRTRDGSGVDEEDERREVKEALRRTEEGERLEIQRLVEERNSEALQRMEA